MNKAHIPMRSSCQDLVLQCFFQLAFAHKNLEKLKNFHPDLRPVGSLSVDGCIESFHAWFQEKQGSHVGA